MWPRRVGISQSQLRTCRTTQMRSQITSKSSPSTHLTSVLTIK